jgi:hypothetical protein
MNPIYYCIETAVLTQSLPIMEITYKLTQKDFAEAFIAHRNRSKLSRWLFRLFTFLMFACLGFGLFGAVFFPMELFLSSYLPWLLLGIFWIFFVWGGPRYMARIQFKKQPSAQSTVIFSSDPAGVQWKWDGGSSNVEWKHFIRILDAKNHFLFYGSPVYFHIVPKRALTAEQMADFQAVIKTHMPQGKLK